MSEETYYVPTCEELGFDFEITDEALLLEKIPQAFDLIDGKPVVREESIRYCIWRGVRWMPGVEITPRKNRKGALPCRPTTTITLT
jgi:hypothetical protein